MENRTGEHLTRFKKQEKIAKKAVQAAKRYYEKKLADNMNQKPLSILVIFIDNIIYLSIYIP